jgi:tRNA nucleotidyltransferase (CCA-adding enzyme)
MRLNYKESIKDLVPASLLFMIEAVAKLSAELGHSAYLVGGGVRDILLKRPIKDLDIVIEGNALDVAELIAEGKDYQIIHYPDFCTATIVLERYRVDLVTARAESYPAPAALPIITPSDLRDDMYRRDFTINSMALALDDYRLIDFFGGYRDLNDGIIRVMHPKSFRDDPTRIFRCIRFEVRYGFRVEYTTAELIKEAVEQGVPKLVSADRVEKELELMLKEQGFFEMLCRMYECGIWQLLFGDQPMDFGQLEGLKKIDANGNERKLWRALALLEGSQNRRLMNVLKGYARYYRLLIEMRSREKCAGFDVMCDILDNGQLYHLYSGIPEVVLRYAQALSESSVYSTNLNRYLNMVCGFQFHIAGNDLKYLGVEPGPVYGILLDQARSEILNKYITDKEGQREILHRIAGRVNH